MVNMMMMAQMMKSLVSRGPTRPRTVASSCMMVRDGATTLGGNGTTHLIYLALSFYLKYNFI